MYVHAQRDQISQQAEDILLQQRQQIVDTAEHALAEERNQVVHMEQVYYTERQQSEMDRVERFRLQQDIDTLHGHWERERSIRQQNDVQAQGNLKQAETQNNLLMTELAQMRFNHAETMKQEFTEQFHHGLYNELFICLTDKYVHNNKIK